MAALEAVGTDVDTVAEPDSVVVEDSGACEAGVGLI